jgi:hypothetical protein
MLLVQNNHLCCCHQRQLKVDDPRSNDHQGLLKWNVVALNLANQSLSESVKEPQKLLCSPRTVNFAGIKLPGLGRNEMIEQY